MLAFFYLNCIFVQKFFFLGLLISILSGCGGSFWEEVKEEKQQIKETLGIGNSKDRQAEIPSEGPGAYQVQIEGLPSDLIPLYESHSNLFEFITHPPETLEGLKRRAWSDLPSLEKVLRSGGYYDGSIDFEVTPGLAKVKINLGQAYTIEDVRLEGAPDVSLPSFDVLEIEPGKPIRAQALLDAQEALMLAFSQEGYPFAEVDLEPLEINCETQTARVLFKVKPGPLTLFGPLTIEELNHLPPIFVENLVPWKEGDRFDSRLLEHFRHALIITNIFVTVEIQHPQEAPPHLSEHEPYRMPITARTVVGKTRYVGGGVQYASSEGSSVKFFWGNYNFRERGEKLSLTGQVGRKKSLLEAVHSIPQFLRPDLTWETTLKGIKEWTQAYKKKGGSILGTLKKYFSEQFSISIGAGYEVNRLYKEVAWRRFHFPAFPIELNYGKVDNILNPTQGWRISADLTFYPKVLGALSTFVQVYVKPAFFIPLGQRWVMGLWAGMGVLSGDQKSDFPPDRLFYAGGAGSVRGYKSQMLGPLDAMNKPLGGRSILEGGIEVTFKATDTLGWVAFYEGGNVFSSSTPQLNFRWGAGFGIRYFTAIGPLRLDIAFPLNRRPGIDGRVQIYAGVGSSF